MLEKEYAALGYSDEEEQCIMNICIVGWYGTETLGDRSILDGIIHIFLKQCSNLNVRIGSLFPFFTQRTIFEDMPLYRLATGNIDISIFEVYNKELLHKAISASDILIMGGGPLMDLEELYILLHAFRYAKRHGKTTALVGCGYGPLHGPDYIKCVGEIVHNSDVIIMRSESCKERILDICCEKDRSRVFASMDPAMISVMKYNFNQKLTGEGNKKINHGSWVMNIRDMDYVASTKSVFYGRIKRLVESIAEQVPHLILMPMHSFSIGGDDRYIENMVRFEIGSSKIDVMQQPPSLIEAYNTVSLADGCIGMRYHSIVFHTYLNGNNYIVDYTDPYRGKIRAFLDSYDKRKFYANRYININEDSYNSLVINNYCFDRFQFDNTVAEQSITFYSDLISKARNKEV